MRIGGSSDHPPRLPLLDLDPTGEGSRNVKGVILVNDFSCGQTHVGHGEALFLALPRNEAAGSQNSRANPEQLHHLCLGTYATLSNRKQTLLYADTHTQTHAVLMVVGVLGKLVSHTSTQSFWPALHTDTLNMGYQNHSFYTCRARLHPPPLKSSPPLWFGTGCWRLLTALLAAFRVKVH